MHTNRLYFAQHGLAINETENPDRPLSAAGIDQTRAIARLLLSSGISFSQVFHSGKTRARQTAEIFASVLGITAISAAAHLSPADEVTDISDNLQADSLYVGHLPHLERLVSFLITGQMNPAIIKFQNSAVVCLENISGQYIIRWFLSPDLIQK